MKISLALTFLSKGPLIYLHDFNHNLKVLSMKISDYHYS